MKKPELIDAAATKAGVTKKATEQVLGALLEVITDALKKGEDVDIIGFGKFTISERPAREGVNPQTKEKIQIAPSKTPKFKAGKKLKDAIK